MREACGKLLGRDQNYGGYMYSQILTENMDQIIVSSMIRHETETKRENVALDKESQQNIEKVNQMGEFPIILY